jgi:hypothetical protein
LHFDAVPPDMVKRNLVTGQRKVYYAYSDLTAIYVCYRIRGKGTASISTILAKIYIKPLDVVQMVRE